MIKKMDEHLTELKLISEDNNHILPGEIVIGKIIALDTDSQPLVDYPENPQSQPLQAVSTLAVYKKHIGREVAILFANGNPARPVVMGMIHSPLNEMLDNFSQPQIENPDSDKKAEIEDIRVDGKRLVIEGHEEIVLKCGASSITLTKEGKILIRGKYLMNRSTGVNRILGGTVQIN